MLSKSDQWFSNVRNRAEYDSVVRLRDQLRALPPPSDPTDEELLGDSFEIPKRSQEQTHLPRRVSHRWLEWPFSAIAAGIAVLGCVTLAILFQTQFFLWSTYRSYSMRVGQQQQSTLGDRTNMMPGGGTSLQVLLASKERTVVFCRGEALFEVRRDPHRPFVVRAATGSTTAVGADFVVRRYSRRSNRVDAWVMKETVEVASARDAVPGITMPFTPGSWVRLNRGQEVTYDDRARANPACSSDVRATFGLNRLVYRQQPLGEVIEDIQRYTTRQIDIDPDVAALKYSGYVLPQKLGQWMRGLPEVFPELAIEDHGGTIRIRARPRRPVYRLESVAR